MVDETTLALLRDASNFQAALKSGMHPKFDFSGSIYAALESQGVYPSRADAFVEVLDATAADAELLGVVTGRGLLCMNCITTRSDGLPFSLETTKYHPDRYRFRAILEHRAGL